MEEGCWTLENPEFRSVICVANGSQVGSEITSSSQYTNEFDNFETMNFDNNAEEANIKKENHFSDPMRCFNQSSVKTEPFTIFDAGRCATMSSAIRLSPLSSTSDYCSLSSPRLSTSSEGEPAMELYHDLIMQHLVKDIQLTCNRLRIPSDPKSWSVQDTQRWLINVANQYQLADVPFEHLSLPGHIVCGMGRDTLKETFPSGGELVHAQLNVWATANDYYQRCQIRQTEFVSQYSREDSVFIPASAQMLQTQHYGAPASVTEELPPKANRPMLIKIENPQQIDPDLHSPNSDSGISTDTEEHGACQTPNMMSMIPDGCSYVFKSNIHLWQFLRELLGDVEQYGHYIRWLDRPAGVFKIEDSFKLSKLWGQRKHRPAMNYDKLSRSLRQYYKKGILKKTLRSQRLVYQFLSPYHTC